MISRVVKHRAACVAWLAGVFGPLVGGATSYQGGSNRTRPTVPRLRFVSPREPIRANQVHHP